MTSVSDKLHVRDAKEGSVKGYAGDTATTSEIKAKLLADDIVPSRHVKVETTDGVVPALRYRRFPGTERPC